MGRGQLGRTAWRSGRGDGGGWISLSVSDPPFVVASSLFPPSPSARASLFRRHLLHHLLLLRLLIQLLVPLSGYCIENVMLKYACTRVGPMVRNLASSFRGGTYPDVYVFPVGPAGLAVRACTRHSSPQHCCVTSGNAGDRHRGCFLLAAGNRDRGMIYRNDDRPELR